MYYMNYYYHQENIPQVIPGQITRESLNYGCQFKKEHTHTPISDQRRKKSNSIIINSLNWQENLLETLIQLDIIGWYKSWYSMVPSSDFPLPSHPFPASTAFSSSRPSSCARARAKKALALVPASRAASRAWPKRGSMG